PESATLAVDAGGTIQITFYGAPDPDHTGEYWGLRWEGDHRIELNQLASADPPALTWDDSTASGTAGIFYDGGTTYVCVRESWPPTVLTNDLTVEIAPPYPNSIVIHALDVDAVPGAPDIISRELTCISDTDSNPETVTLLVGAPATITITLTVTNAAGPASAEATLEVIEVPEGIDGSLTWNGQASLTEMERNEWMWGQNWTGGIPPFNPSNARLVFADLDVATSVMEADYSVRYVDYTNTGGKHITDLGGNALTIVGDDLGTPLSGGISSTQKAGAEAEITNGTLHLGTLDAVSDLLVGSNEADNAKLSISANVDCYAKDIKVATGRNSVAVLDLSNSSIVGGALRAQNIYIAYPDQNSGQNGQIILSDTMGLTDLSVSGTFFIAEGRPSTGRIGDPNNNWKLPPGTNLTLGVDGVSRGQLIIARCGYFTADGYLAASEGGTCNAFLSLLSVSQVGDQGNSNGTFDLSAMDSCAIDATNVQIGMQTTGFADRAVNARVCLPPGTLLANTIVVASTTQPHLSTSASLLQLNGTVAAVNTSVTVGPTGTIETIMGGESCGLDLADTATLAVSAGGKVRITFGTPTISGIYYGLRWMGDYVADLDALKTAGLLAWNDSALDDPASIFTDGDYTYVGVAVAVAKVTSFSVTDATSGSSLVTNEDVVNVAIVAEPAPGETIVGYVVNETGIEPADGWTDPLTSYAIGAAPGGTVTLYAWVKDTAGNVASASASIVYSTAVPAVSSVVVTDNGNDTATATWDTDIPAQGWVNYGPVALSGATPNTAGPETALVTSHSVTFATAAGVNYKIVIVNNEIASAPFFWPRPWPIDGDANMDCRVNILDLISIRNKLNQDAGTGDNWKADVNEDTRINILDLIFVRNKLNTQCP
ncbi:MAG TPA: dockerin type I repeat-containing protein, partial [Planctomycetota bacterium]|nr:dockerin type I repeat-containing protein [Planctomycetota bacterium]